MKASDFDKKFDAGAEDVSDDLDMQSATRPFKEQRRVNVDFPVWMIEPLDRQARRLGVTRQSIIKVWIAERLEKVANGGPVGRPANKLVNLMRESASLRRNAVAHRLRAER